MTSIRSLCARFSVYLLLLSPLACIGVVNQLESDSPAKRAEMLSLLGIAAAAVPAGGGEAGPEGAVITSSDGAFTVMIPPDAMTASVEFTITRYTPASSALPSGHVPTTAVYEITPSYVFERPVTVSLTLDIATIQGLNLNASRARGFSASSSAPEENSGRFTGWAAHASSVQGDRLVFTTESFSLFGGGAPPPGNVAPVIQGAFYYFKPGCQYLPYRVRAEVVEPDSDPVTVYLNTAPAGVATNLLPMTREGATDWYSVDLPYEVMSQTGIQIQVLAVDSFGGNSTRPSAGIFVYPASSGNAVYIAGYDRDADNDGRLCAWEVDNARSDSNPGDGAGATDSDGDGVPDVSDYTPNGETNPAIDSLTMVPTSVAMDVGESTTLGVRASLAGAFRFVNASYHATGNGLNGQPAGSLSGSVFTAAEPGAAAVHAVVGATNATVAVSIRDSVGPNNITTLAATAIHSTRIRLNWTAPGDDGGYGQAAAYQVGLSTAPIPNNAACIAAAVVAHSLTPRPAGLAEQLDVNGLSPNTTYHFCIRAVDSKGNFNQWSGAASAVTPSAPDLSAPANITGATATAGLNSVLLSWNAVGDDGVTGAATAYEIRRSTTPINNDAQCTSAVDVLNNVSPAVAGSPLSFLVSGLSDNTIYYFCIRAFDEVNNRSSWSGLLTATTPIANQAPTADAGANQIIGLGQAASLSAAASVDPDAAGCLANTSNYAYSWSLANKPLSSARSTADIGGRTTANAAFTPDVEGVYTLQLQFTDDPGLCQGGPRSATTTVTITASVACGLGPADIAQPARWPAVQQELAAKIAAGVAGPIQYASYGDNSTWQNAIAAVVAPNGHVYGIRPGNGGAVVKLNTTTLAETRFGPNSASGTAYWGAALAPNGKIYAPPYDSTSVLVVDPASDTATTFGSLAGSSKWASAVLAANGKIYSLPVFAGNVLEINPTTETTSTFGSVTSGHYYFSGVLGPDGKIYGIPNATPSTPRPILVIDPDARTVSTFGNVAQSYGYAALAPNGKIFALPRENVTAPVLEVDPVARTVGSFGSVTSTWKGLILGANGKLYGLPWGAQTVAELDPVARTVVALALPGGTPFGGLEAGALGLDGKIYGVSYNVGYRVIINTQPNATYCSSVTLSPYFNRR